MTHRPSSPLRGGLRRFAGVLTLLSLLPLLSHADQTAPQARLGGDLFVAGGALTVRDAVGGDLFAAGGSVDVDAPVTGDALVVGGKLRLGVDVGQSVYAAGGQLTIDGKVGHNARVAGGRVEFGPKADVQGNLSVAGGQVRLLGAVRGHVQVAGGRLWIDGPVGGDVLATSGQVALGPNARIAGKLRHRGGEPVQQDPAAQVQGGVEEWPAWHRDAATPPHPPRVMRSGIAWWWTGGLIVLAAILLALGPKWCARNSQTLRERPGLSLLLGFVSLVCVPVAVLVLLITIIGIPLALLGAALYVALLPLAYVSTAIGLGDEALRAWRSDAAMRWGWRIAASAVVLIGLALLGHVPWLGGLLTFLALLAGLGAFALQWRRVAPAAAG
jgi:hypothetical protein